ncbi:MAG: hypothetical protein ACI89L_001530 [Phycisphaerales bacterium]|jgi:hypothetical protein
MSRVRKRVRVNIRIVTRSIAKRSRPVLAYSRKNWIGLASLVVAVCAVSIPLAVTPPRPATIEIRRAQSASNVALATDVAGGPFANSIKISFHLRKPFPSDKIEYLDELYISYLLIKNTGDEPFTWENVAIPFVFYSDNENNKILDVKRKKKSPDLRASVVIELASDSRSFYFESDALNAKESILFYCAHTSPEPKWRIGGRVLGQGDLVINKVVLDRSLWRSELYLKFMKILYLTHAAVWAVIIVLKMRLLKLRLFQNIFMGAQTIFWWPLASVWIAMALWSMFGGDFGVTSAGKAEPVLLYWAVLLSVNVICIYCFDRDVRSLLSFFGLKLAIWYGRGMYQVISNNKDD